MQLQTTATSTKKSVGKNVSLFYPPPAADLDTPWTINVYSARHERKRWARYNQVANQSYAARGLEAVGEEQIIDVDRYPTYFAEASLDECELPIGGVRIHLSNVAGCVPLLDELDGFTDTAQIQDFLDGLQHEGISHGGGLWIDLEHTRSGLAGDLARASISMFIASSTKWSVATGHHRVLDAWGSLGWHPILDLPAFPFPDDRYQTNVLLCEHERWPTDLRSWASAQVGDSTLDGSGVRFTIDPMRVGS